MTTDPSLCLSARWEVCVNCLQKRLFAAAGRPMLKFAVGEAHVTVASASAKPQVQESFMGHAVNAMTGSVPYIMGKPVMVSEDVEYVVR